MTAKFTVTTLLTKTKHGLGTDRTEGGGHFEGHLEAVGNCVQHSQRAVVQHDEDEEEDAEEKGEEG